MMACLVAARIDLISSSSRTAGGSEHGKLPETVHKIKCGQPAVVCSVQSGLLCMSLNNG
jgi:hypothetical protein